MRDGKGVWVELESGAVHAVTTHDAWLLDPTNQRMVGLGEAELQEMRRLDPQRDIDQIRMIGVRAGLIRLRDHRAFVSVQFHAKPDQIDRILIRVLEALPAVTDDPFSVLKIHNLRDDTSGRLDVPELRRRLDIASHL